MFENAELTCINEMSSEQRQKKKTHTLPLGVEQNYLYRQKCKIFGLDSMAQLYNTTIVLRHRHQAKTNNQEGLTFQLDIIIFYKRHTNFYNLKA